MAVPLIQIKVRCLKGWKPEVRRPKAGEFTIWTVS